MPGLQLLVTTFFFVLALSSTKLARAQINGSDDAEPPTPQTSADPSAYQAGEEVAKEIPVSSQPVAVVPAAPPKERSPFAQGRVSFSLFLGSQRNFGQTYFVVGGGIGYWLFSGVEVGFSAARWFGGDPGVTRLSPRARLVLVNISGRIKPFVGGFYNRWIIDNTPNFDTAGARGGIAWATSANLILTLGAVYEVVVSDCDSGVSTCSWLYPEFSFALSF